MSIQKKWNINIDLKYTVTDNYVLVETEVITMSAISGFFGEYRWLSNFYDAVVIYDETEFRSVEHAYVYSKYKQKPTDLFQFNDLTAGQVKRLGKTIEMREDFDDVKVDIMTELVFCKFSDRNPELVQKLIETGDAHISETNSWGDTFWGVNLEGVGLNMLGKIIMARRDQINNSEA